MRSAVATACIGLLLAGCAAGGKPAAEALPASTPLPLDPTHDYELATWWTNGDRLLELVEAGVYRLYEGTNHYHRPAQRGRWWQQSYASLWLEPYDERPRDAIRVSVRRVGDEIVLDLPRTGPLFALAAPPRVLEDRLVGNWSGEAGTLRLGADQRYSYLPRAVRASGPATLASQEGAWLVEGEFLILQPDSSGLAPTIVRIHELAGSTFLDTEDGRLDREPLALPGKG